MAVVYYPKNQFMFRRDTISASYESLVLAVSPNTILYFDTASGLTGISASLIPITSSWAESASFALSAISSSWAPGSTPGTTLYTGSTYEITSSWAINTVNGGSGTTLYTASTYEITSSWSSNSVSASWAPNSEGTTLYTASTYQITSSWANNAVSASWPPFITDTGTTLYTGSTYEITSSWSEKSISSSFSSNTISASWAPFNDTGTTLYTASTYEITSSWSNNSITSSYSLTSSYTFSSSYINVDIQIYKESSSFASSSLSSSTSISSSWASSSLSSVSSSYSYTASWALNTINGGTQLTTGSTYPITSSWSNNVISSSFSSNAISASYAPTDLVYSASVSTQITNKQSSLITGSTIPITSSWSNNAISASYAPSDGSGTTLVTSSTYPITSSWSQQSTSASYSPVEPDYSASISTIIGTKQSNLITASLIPITSSWSNNAISASWPPFVTDTGTTLYTASTYQITSSWSQQSISASFSPVEPDYSSSVSTQITNKQTSLITGSTIPITSSWANNVISSSFSLNSMSSSWAPGSSPGTTLYTGSTYEITSSWAEKSITSSYSPIDVDYSASVSIIFSTKQPNLITGNTYTITSSWSNNAISASWPPFVIDTGTVLFTGSTYPITSSWAITASFALSSISASSSPIEIGYSASVSSQISNKQGSLITGSTIPITSSWSNNAISASWAPVDGIGTTLYTASTYQITSSWSNNSVSSSFPWSNTETSSFTTQQIIINSPMLGQSSDNGSIIDTQYNITESGPSLLTIKNSGSTVMAVGKFGDIQIGKYSRSEFGWPGGNSGLSVTRGSNETDMLTFNILAISGSTYGDVYAAKDINMTQMNAVSLGMFEYNTVNSGSNKYVIANWAKPSSRILKTYYEVDLVRKLIIDALSCSFFSESIQIGGNVNDLNSIYKLNVQSGSGNFSENLFVTGSIFGNVTGSLFGTSSWANNSISSSWAPNSTSGTTLFTGSTYPITSSWANNSISASWPPFVTDTGTTLFTGSTYPITSSWTNNVISSSFSLNTKSASYSPVEIGYSSSVSSQITSKQGSLVTGSIIPITSSWSTNVISSSYAPIEVGYSASVSSLFSTKQPNLVTGNTYTITSSWSNNSISSSFSSTAISASWAPFTDTGTILITGSTYPITSSWTNNVISSSFSSNAISASWAPQNPGSGTTLYTGSTYEITSSWAISSSWAANASSASYVRSSSFSTNSRTSSFTTNIAKGSYNISSSWASSSISSIDSTNAISSSYLNATKLFLQSNDGHTYVVKLVTDNGLVTLNIEQTPVDFTGFYGLTSQGGSGNYGTAFRITPSGSFSLLYSWPNIGNQEVPVGNFIQATDGYLYGILQDGGSYNMGSTFKMTTNGEFTRLHDFNGTTDGGFPNGTLIQANDGNFYGMCSQGGAYTIGNIFKQTLAGAFSTIHSFSSSLIDGYSPLGTVIQATDGYLYGMTNFGGTGSAGGNGVIFKCDTSGNYTRIYSFTGSNDGKRPNGSLIQATDGKLYGVCSQGGSSNLGTIFSITTGSVFSLLFSCTTASGSSPQGRLLQATDGNFYGMTTNGGTNSNGTIFKITPSGSYTRLYSFLSGSTTGGSPSGNSLIEWSDGDLYGMTREGGDNNFGVIFKITKSGSYTLLHSFDTLDGIIPVGDLFGMTNVF